MEVVNKSNMCNTKFDDLEMGDVFELEGGYYMKVAETTFGSLYNAVSLTDGELHVVHKATLVFKLNARCEVTYTNE